MNNYEAQESNPWRLDNNSLLAIIPFPIRAHTPSNMTLSYDYDNQILTVTVIHSVADMNSHYIEQIIINKNTLFVMDRNYTSQASTSSMSDTFNVAAADNDVFQVTAISSVSGQITLQLTVSSGGLQTQPPPQIPGFPLAAIAIGLMFVLGFTLFGRRKLSPK